MPGHPIDEENDVPAFLLHHRLEGVDERRRKKSERLASAKRPKAKKLSMHSLKPVTMKAHSGSLGFRYSGSGANDPVCLDEIGKNFLVPAFLETVELDGALQQPVRDGLGIAQHAQARLALGLHRNVPNRQADEAVAGLAIERRPIDVSRACRGYGCRSASGRKPSCALPCPARSARIRRLPRPGRRGRRPLPPRPQTSDIASPLPPPRNGAPERAAQPGCGESARSRIYPSRH